jgi:hypothetical protein
MKACLGFMIFGFPPSILGYITWHVIEGWKFGKKMAQKHTDEAVAKMAKERDQ